MNFLNFLNRIFADLFELFEFFKKFISTWAVIFFKTTTLRITWVLQNIRVHFCLKKIKRHKKGLCVVTSVTCADRAGLNVRGTRVADKLRPVETTTSLRSASLIGPKNKLKFKESRHTCGYGGSGFPLIRSSEDG